MRPATRLAEAVEAAGRVGWAAVRQRTGLGDPLVLSGAAGKAAEVLVDPGGFSLGPGGDLVEMVITHFVQLAFKLGTDALDKRQIVCMAAARGLQGWRELARRFVREKKLDPPVANLLSDIMERRLPPAPPGVGGGPAPTNTPRGPQRSS